ncbi:hypothetical protein [Baekduia sp.]|jgi:hypothetical protein|uniref:hypothetical protein n=1 Tax=Baekduia sp. TaxID=2600305 RepID=UPI002DFC7C8A|nr:hypothetical protein [Baekduia sp.]
MAQAVLMALAVCALLILLVWPLISDTEYLMGDAAADAGFIGHQADSLRQGYLPSHFVYSDSGIFYAVFAFYGGTLFAIAGAISLLVGSPTAAQAIVYALALAAAYGGWLWLARMAGVRSWHAHAPAILYVTAPYVLTNVDVREDLTESVATAMLPLLLASALSVLRADRLRAGPAAALAASTIVLGGTHNLTLLWATTVLGLAALALLAGVPQARHMVTRRGLLRVLAIAVPAMAVNAWYLLPDLAYYSHTVIAHRIDEWRASARTVNPAIDAKHLFSVGRVTPFPGSAFSAALPVLAIAWVLLAAVVVHRQWRQAWARTLAVISLVTVAVLVVMTHPRLISALPDPWLMIQYSYRLETFALLGICGAVIAALALIGHGRHRWLTALLLPILAYSVFSALRQVGNVPRADIPAPVSIDNLATFSTGDFADVSVRQRPPEQAQVVVFTRKDAHRDRLDVTVKARPREVIYMDVMAIAPMVDIQGARVVGRWARPPLRSTWQPYWYLALQVDDDATPGKAHITIREARTLPIVGGRIISILGLLGLAANAVVIVRGRRRS